MSEWQYYDGNDKHQIAFAALTGPRGQAMVKWLGYQDRKATEVEACLNCHAFVPGTRRQTPNTLPRE